MWNRCVEHGLGMRNDGCPYCEIEALKAEVEVLSNGECLGCKDHEDTLKRELRESDRAEKAEAERDRLREANEAAIFTLKYAMAAYRTFENMQGVVAEVLANLNEALNHDKSSNR